MLMTFIGYLALFILMLSIINSLKEFILFIAAIRRGVKFNIDTKGGWFLALSIAYILTYIFA